MTAQTPPTFRRRTLGPWRCAPTLGLLCLILLTPTPAFASEEAAALDRAPDAFPELPSPPRLTVQDEWTLDKPVIFSFDPSAESGETSPDVTGADDQPVTSPSMQSPLHRGPVYRVHIDTVGGERLTLQSQRHVTFGKNNLIFKTSTRTYEDVCTTPCTVDVAAGAYRLAVADADNWRRARTLEIRRRVVIEDDATLLLSRRSRRGARAGFFSAMAATVVSGFAVAMVSAIEQRDPNRDLAPQRTPTMRALSTSLMGAGVGFFIGGVLSRDNYRVQQAPLSTPTAP